MPAFRLALAALMLVLTLSPTASGAGGPVAGGNAGGVGTTLPAHGLRYVAIVDGDRMIVQRIHKTTGRVWQWRALDGQHVISTVAQDFSTTGLLGDAGTLVDGYPTLDAVSPDGETLYLVEYQSADRSKYVVRAFDVERGRLLREPVVDPWPATISASRGRWLGARSPLPRRERGPRRRATRAESPGWLTRL